MTEGTIYAKKQQLNLTRNLCTSTTQSPSSWKVAADLTFQDTFQTLKQIKTTCAICSFRLRGWITAAPGCPPPPLQPGSSSTSKERGNSWNSFISIRTCFAHTWTEVAPNSCVHPTAERGPLLFICFPSLPAYPASFGEWSAVVSSTEMLTSLLDWLGFKLLSPLGGGGSFLFFLAKKFLKVWNLDFFFPATWEKWKFMELGGVG